MAIDWALLTVNSEPISRATSPIKNQRNDDFISECSKERFPNSFFTDFPVSNLYFETKYNVIGIKVKKV
jgi:hypothetical protein